MEAAIGVEDNCFEQHVICSCQRGVAVLLFSLAQVTDCLNRSLRRHLPPSFVGWMTDGDICQQCNIRQIHLDIRSFVRRVA
jgi:hypothetical protein